MLALKLAYKNLMGAGLRTWLNVIVLSLSFVVIIWFKGLLDGWDRQAKRDMIAWETGGGQYWHPNYDPLDPYTLEDSHVPLGPELQKEVENGNFAAVLITQGSIYPEGRMITTLLKGINQNQKFLQIPVKSFPKEEGVIPAWVGAAMARSARIDSGDYLTVRWRDVNGTFDAREVFIAGVFTSNVPGIEANQLWLPLDKLQEMTGMEGEATLITVPPDYDPESMQVQDRIFRDQAYLHSDIDKIIQSKKAGTSIFYLILLLLAMLAIFDTQVLSIFRRQREIGTYIAMGMTRRQVVGLFTVEGAMHALLAILLGALYGTPLFIMQARNGLTMPVSGDDYGIAMSDTLYPVYGISLVITTVLIVCLTTAIVSYLPARKITKMNPTEAIKGKLQ